MDALAVDLAACAENVRPDADTAALLRRRLGLLLAAHLAKEDALLYPRLRASGDAQTAVVADRLAREMGGLAGAWGDYLRCWSTHRIESEWSGFARDTRAVTAALRARIAQEDAHLYPLFDRV